MEINITTGSQKQNAWATQIARTWLASIDREIESIERRISDIERRISDGDPLLDPHKTLLEQGRQKLLTAAATMRASDVIDRKGNDYGQALISQARKAFSR